MDLADVITCHQNDPTYVDHPIAWQVRPDDKQGQPDPELHCNYCGSLHPERFFELLNTPGTHAEVADWKYGWPHKVYLTYPSASPEAIRETGRSYGKEHPAEGTPHTGTYATVTFKFYAKHLLDWPRIAEEAVQKKIFDCTGIRFQLRDGRLFYCTTWEVPQEPA